MEKQRSRRGVGKKIRALEARDTQQRAKERTQEAKQEKRFLWEGTDLRVIWALMIHLPSVPEKLSSISPAMKVRRCSKPSLTHGCAWFDWEFRVQVSVWEGLPLPSVLHTLIHELSHLVACIVYHDMKHGPGFDEVFKKLEAEWKESYPQHPCEDL